MNQDVLNACQTLYSTRRNTLIYFLEDNNGQILFGLEINQEGWNSICKWSELNPSYFKKFHLFKVEHGKLEWVESYDPHNKLCDIPFEISDEDFLIIAKKAHEQNITFNQLVVKLLEEYIQQKKEDCMSHTERNKPHKKLTPKEEKLVKKNKFHHPVHIKSSGHEDEFSQAAKKEAKKEKHKGQRKQAKKVIKESIKDVQIDKDTDN